MTTAAAVVTMSAAAAGLSAGVLRWRRGGPVALPDLTRRTALITGGTTGIGRATATALARAGATVVLTSRDAERGAAVADELGEVARGGVSALVLDLADPASVRAAAASFRADHDRLDLLIHNAGRMVGQRTTTPDGFEATLATNHLGPTLLTAELLGLVAASAPARIVVLASLAHREGRLDLDDLQNTRGPYRALQVYASAKLANVLFTRELARRLEGSGVTVNCCHPGTIRSGFGQDGDSRGLLRTLLTIARPVFPGPEVGARAPLYLATASELEGITGAYLDGRRVARPSRAAQDDALARGLWERTAQLLDLPRDWPEAAVLGTDPVSTAPPSDGR
ncbi:SDR family oxidoreductase [Nitriliruptor alkaliphilus]|uniref:SDR family oxidoreductase n=1 Tax=Nitriliruptor alkaliphilus TaxID=427918 RepID=UPI001B807ACE|nr:SDR family oxidoreductase [Nitriliruptor alkaliphilus]